MSAVSGHLLYLHPQSLVISCSSFAVCGHLLVIYFTPGRIFFFVAGYMGVSHCCWIYGGCLFAVGYMEDVSLLLDF
ncbi:unnamed protein product [Staurois parvus]|uniref:Uncharacterized protein n=1 Tax=Staurois parvus TaxID=386267 RepID=A0ABN9B7Q2_9NEOB|nr:unnamed protein product [Staurois parvus]